MERMGHSSTRAALLYLHSTEERQRALADAVGKVARSALRKAKKPDGGKASGTKVHATGSKPHEDQQFSSAKHALTWAGTS
jgi:hypothetical protein